jgi:hypothetical protein
VAQGLSVRPRVQIPVLPKRCVKQLRFQGVLLLQQTLALLAIAEKSYQGTITGPHFRMWPLLGRNWWEQSHRECGFIDHWDSSFSQADVSISYDPLEQKFKTL